MGNLLVRPRMTLWSSGSARPLCLVLALLLSLCTARLTLYLAFCGTLFVTSHWLPSSSPVKWCHHRLAQCIFLSPHPFSCDPTPSSSPQLTPQFSPIRNVHVACMRDFVVVCVWLEIIHSGLTNLPVWTY